MAITSHITTSLHGVHVILKTITRTRTLKGGGFGLTWYSWDKVLEGRHYVCQHLRNPIFMDSVRLGSYSHRPRWPWVKLASLFTLVATFFVVPSPFYQKVNDILNPNWTFLPVV